MQFKFLLASAFVGLALADGPAIQKALDALIPQLESLDVSFKALTKANSHEISQEVSTKAAKLVAIAKSSAKDIEATKPIAGISEMFFLITTGKKAIGAVNSTMHDLLAKKDIIKGSPVRSTHISASCIY